MAESQKMCEACTGDIPAMSAEEAQSWMAHLPGWQLADESTKLRRRFTFADFAGALTFVNALGEVAEEAGHHPDITFGWGYALVEIWTHAVGGLTKADFVLAQRADNIFVK